MRYKLTTEQKEKVYARFAVQRKPLCCKDGMRWLLTIMGPKKAKEVNEFAYESLGCTNILESTFEYWKRRLANFLYSVDE